MGHFKKLEHEKLGHLKKGVINFETENEILRFLGILKNAYAIT